MGQVMYPYPFWRFLRPGSSSPRNRERNCSYSSRLDPLSIEEGKPPSLQVLPPLTDSSARPSSPSSDDTEVPHPQPPPPPLLRYAPKNSLRGDQSTVEASPHPSDVAWPCAAHRKGAEGAPAHLGHLPLHARNFLRVRGARRGELKSGEVAYTLTVESRGPHDQQALPLFARSPFPNVGCV